MSASSSIGMSVASAINSTTSNTCVHEASLLSRTPSWAEIDSPLAHMPGNPEMLPVLRSFENKQKVGELQLNTASRIPCSFLSLWWYMKSAETACSVYFNKSAYGHTWSALWYENWNFPVNFYQMYTISNFIKNTLVSNKRQTDRPLIDTFLFTL